MSTELRSHCTLSVPGNREMSPADIFRQMADWCQDNQIKHDIYGQGDDLQQFETKVADLLGYEAGLFVISGTMTQPTALQLACMARKNPIVAMHPSSHIYLHEAQGYLLQQRFTVLPVGNPYQIWSLADLQEWPDDIAAVLYELPMREIGGQLPEWDDLNAIKAHCREQGIHLHMDGARLWEAKAWYGREYSEIADGFDSAYVSLYKGIGGLGGSMLLGDQALIKKARLWMQRQGGNVFRRTPYSVSAAMQFDQRLALMPALFDRTQQLYRILKDYPLLTPNPAAPQANMLHLYLPVSAEKASVIRDRLATEQKIWLGNPQQAALPEQSFLEWYVGDNLLNLSDDKLREILSWLSGELVS
ncbi:beta-eliminating lyase-related protein [Photobacterium sp. 2_MG-2023]|uniref:threonine aldolase family protein n=1 Tax=Photobacterium sp. 2_MG-2023 TaxID=3062663 RepID=UPI0026E3C6FC|nr:beta-eliminating lyase-related protein [Photobacterium sp. 2_MG-2023]MDO6583055.1 beta-eliminating lyase-related protein [Photobacterium sp. 2_MG-2023]